jgi:diphthamide biosynthesis protein 7
MFGAATSTGSIGFYHLTRSPEDDIKIVHNTTVQYFAEDILITAFQWHPIDDSIGLTLTTGEVCLMPCKPIDVPDMASSGSVVTHHLEAWTLAFSATGVGVYSGGDDSALKYTDLAENLQHSIKDTHIAEYGDMKRAPWSDRKIHGAGVTAILPLYSTEDGSTILTGSYDDHIRLINAPTAGRRTVLAELNLGGGVWRLKLLNRPLNSGPAENHISDGILLLASCMYAGAKILSLKKDTNGEWQFEVLARFEEHKSMNYGSDCQPFLNKQDQRTFITTSFYDRLLCLWRY